MRFVFYKFCFFGLVCFATGFLSMACAYGEETQIGEILVEEDIEREATTKPSAFASVIHPQDYHQQLLTLPELLSRQVGLHVQSFGGLGQLSTVSIRGSTAEQVSVFVDGIKINTAQGGAVDFSTLPLGSIERIEVLRGGSSSQFGSDAIGGVINIVTQRAQKKLHLEFKASAGSYVTFQTHTGFSKKFGKLGLTLDHTHLSSEGDYSFLSTGVQLSGGVTLGGGQTFKRLHNSFISEGFLTRLDTNITPQHRLTFTNDFFFTSRDLPGTELETTQLFPTNPLEAHENLFRNATGLKWQWDDVGVENLSLSLRPTYKFERSHFTDPSPALGPPLNVTFTNQSIGMQTKLVYEKQYSGHQHLLTLAHDFNYDQFKDSSPIAGVVLSGTRRRQTHAVFFQDEISLWNEKLFLNPTFRFEHASDFGQGVALHFGLVAKPLHWLTLKTNVENSFRYPNFNELFFPDQGFIRGNPNLKKEEALSFDVGANLRYKWVDFEVSYFRQAIDNSIVFVPISAFTIAPVNSGSVTSQGFEAVVHFKPVSFMTLSGNYTLLHAKQNGTGKQLPGRPRHLANARLEFNWKYGSIFSAIQYIDKLPIDFANTKFVNRRALVNVGGTLKWSDHYFVTVEGKNVGNVQTLDSVGFPLPRATVFVSFGYKT